MPDPNPNPANGGSGNSGGSANTGGSGTSREGREGGQRHAPRVRRRRRDHEEPTDFVDLSIRRYGTRDNAIAELGKQTYELREDRREQDAEIEALKAKVPPDGAVILTGAKADAWKKIDALATELKLPEDKLGEKIVERVKKADTLETEQTKTAKSAARRAAAEKAEMNGEVLDPLLDQFGLDVELKEIQVQGTDGKLTPQQVPHVRKAGDNNATWEKLTDFAAKDGSPLKPFAAALAKKGDANAGGGQGVQGNQGGTSTGFTFPDQRGGTGGAGGNSLVDKMLAKNKEEAKKPNALRPAEQKAS